MINITDTQVFGWEAVIRGMRNPLESWKKSDSEYTIVDVNEIENSPYIYINSDDDYISYAIGPNDQSLMMRLVKAGDEHAKFMRMIHVSMDILAPLYWWKQADTYKVGFVTNSCSTMHKIQAKEFVLEDFSHEHLNYQSISDLKYTINRLNDTRNTYLNGGFDYDENDHRVEFKPKSKYIWWQMIQLLPDSYNQLRTCDTNYATLHKMYHQRKGHKLDEWHDFRAWVEELPYSELITTKPQTLAYADQPGLALGA